MQHLEIQMYFEVSDQDAIATIDEALQPIHEFNRRLYALQQQYGADRTFIFDSLDRGLSFSSLWFKEFPDHLDTKNQFKVSQARNNKGYELRPRKSNKKFYAEFSEGLNEVSYTPLKLALFGDKNVRPSIEYTKKDNAYFISSTLSIVLPFRELTATQYNSCIN